LAIGRPFHECAQQLEHRIGQIVRAANRWPIFQALGLVLEIA